MASSQRHFNWFENQWQSIPPNSGNKTQSGLRNGFIQNKLDHVFENCLGSCKPINLSSVNSISSF